MITGRKMTRREADLRDRCSRHPASNEHEGVRWPEVRHLLWLLDRLRLHAATVEADRDQWQEARRRLACQLVRRACR